MQRGSDKHGPAQDEYLKQELSGLEQADRPTRAEEWRDPEPPADDDPQLRDPRELREPRGGDMSPETVSDVMTPQLVSLPSAAPVTQAAELMRTNGIGDVIVTGNGAVQGVVTDRDLVIRVLAAHRDPERTTVGEVCSPDVVTIHPDASVAEAVDIMRDRAVRRLLVIDDDGQVRGVVTIGDLAVTQDPQSALADISAAPPNT